MLRRLQGFVYRHIQGNAGIYFFVCMFFIIGISTGAFTVKALAQGQKKELMDYMQSFFQVLGHESIDATSVFKQSLINNLQTVLLIWILGITIIGMPFILLVVGIRGLMIGFTVGFLVEEMGIKGMLFSVLSIFPQNLIIIPSLIIIGVMGIGFSKMLIHNRTNKSMGKTRQHHTFKQFLLYSTLHACICVFIILGCAVEAYITPILMKAFSTYIQ